MHSECIIRAKTQGVLEADGNRGYGVSDPSTASLSLLLLAKTSGSLSITLQLFQERLTAFSCALTESNS